MQHGIAYPATDAAAAAVALTAADARALPFAAGALALAAAGAGGGAQDGVTSMASRAAGVLQSSRATAATDDVVAMARCSDLRCASCEHRAVARTLTRAHGPDQPSGGPPWGALELHTASSLGARSTCL